MKSGFLALAVLLSGAVGMASADYVLIKINVGEQEEPVIPGSGMIGVAPGMGPQAGGSNGGGRRPGNDIGMAGGSGGGRGGRGGQGGVGPGGSGGGPMNNRPGQPGGLGVLGQQDAQAEGAIDVIAIVEVDASFKKLQTNLLREVKPFAMDVRTPFGAAKLLNLPAAPEVRVYPTSEEPTVAKRFAAEEAKVFPKNKPGQKPSAEQIQKLAEYALAHGLNDKFVEVMKKLAEDSPTNEAVVAFLKVQTALDRTVPKAGPADLKAHLTDYKEETLKDDKGHFVLYHRPSDNQEDEAQERLKQLEEAFRTYYYWFALKGVALTVPATRLPALLTAKEPEFKHTRDSLSNPPVVGDGIFARREDLTVFCAKPMDARYEMLNNFTLKAIRKYHLSPQEVLSFKGASKGPSTREDKLEAIYCGTLALALKEMEFEAERAGASHDVSRQLLFASGLLPRNVTVPEWVLFGMGSFFETPEHSPWATPTGLSTVYLPIYRNETGSKGKNFEGTPLKTLRKIVTDGYFRELTPDDYTNKTDRLMKARAATWSLTYFLTQPKYFPGLQRYFKNLSEMPRDLELDDAALMDCFARSFGCYDAATKKPNENKLNDLAAEWQGTMFNVNLEAEDFLRVIQEIYAKNNLPVPPEGAPPGQPPLPPGANP